MPAISKEPFSSGDEEPKKASSAFTQLPKGVVLDKDGKPCRTCTSSSAWMSMMKQSTKSPAATTSASAASGLSAPSVPMHTDCPPDVEELGRSTWTFLHTLSATYPEDPSPSMQSTTRQFISLFSNLYPCWVCADDFRGWLAQPENEPQLQTQDQFGRWMCRAHNEVNRKLGKKEFDCDLWKERWKDGWKNGRCD